MAQDETDQDVLAQKDSKVRIQGGASEARPRLQGLPMSKPFTIADSHAHRSMEASFA
jgi:hypothetical protein